ncbi:MAG: hypothetical protein K8F92_16965 [Hyphomicrobium sp.]|uniref:hypothetical protein n=1 Tax=Hyphomicrobium sp. TaxID=82 RepID=UPI0025C3E5CA|nr:hypothetical protein [Hyphomicrobium sp.]MBZ0211319.1 hypothetical protein [Hyphomicrobium sp.]
MLLAHPKVLLSITSIPRRFNTALKEVVTKLQNGGNTVVVCLPNHYKKWGPAEAPDYLTGAGDVVLFRPSKDYGPATKLLGAIEYIESTSQHFDGIITLDDDIYYADTAAAVDYLKQHARERPRCAITIGGLKLEHYPYRNKNGLYGNNVGYVDAVVGFRGVYYPVNAITQDRRIFDFAAELPEFVYHNDDAYFGICLSRMGIPIYAVKPPRTTSSRRRVELVCAQGAGESAVQEKMGAHRVENEMEIYQYAVSKGWLPSREAGQNRDTPLGWLLKRTGLGRNLRRLYFNW